MKIIIHKNFNPWYYTYYLIDLYKLSSNISFSRLISPEEEEKVFASFPKDYFIFLVQQNGLERLIVIGADDKKSFSKTLYDRCDVFGKVNTSDDLINKHAKLTGIGPNFGIGNLNVITLNAIMKQFPGKYFNIDEWKKVFKRSPYNFYNSLNEKVSVQDKYLFYLNFPWKKHSDLTNFRKEIIIQLQILEEERVFEFEGGFSKRRLGYFDGLKQYSAREIYNHKTYLKNIKKSQVVINTPAVHDCLGWKLGEYLKLGKAILSFPIYNSMPGKFINGKHFHQLEDIKLIKSDLLFLFKNDSYRKYLEKNATNYFNHYLSPERVISRLINKAFR